MNFKILLIIPILIGSSVWSSTMIKSIAQDKCYGPAYPDSGLCSQLVSPQESYREFE